jgi:mannose-6-phosphate isomerase
MTPLYPLRFRPILRRYIWGGRKLGELLGKPLGEGDDYAESWEICDRGEDQSVVADGPLAGTTLHDLVTQRGPELLGNHHVQPRFPLLFKFLDARRTLSVQVHPDDAAAAQLAPPDLGKTEAWVVLAAEPGSVIYAGLKRGFDRALLEREAARGTCELCLHRFEPRVGDCVFLRAGTVHALGAGLLVAEIQQASDTTFGCSTGIDWAPDGQPRARGSGSARSTTIWDRSMHARPRRPSGACQPVGRVRQVCARSLQFIVQTWFRDRVTSGGAVERSRCRRRGERPLGAGDTRLLPQRSGPVRLTPEGPAVLLDAFALMG